MLATAFRETSIGGEKDLDNSVLWKSVQGLNSAIESYRARTEEVFRSNLKSVIDYARLDGRDILSDIVDELKRAVRTITLFHPVVVLDARMWMSSEEGPVEIEQRRFAMKDVEQRPVRWFDIVTRSAFRSGSNKSPVITAHA